ncbi:MarR family winged helix-turn-helix transcriptional regulator [Streptomyces sp. BE303]|uniref:MarR family winged helix-turn-helix transcriptional regulator n=1 Tax=Streptomyces sp. BE303 TaxID=3002528 RepID=UPI002E772044|nr:MarR family transcriptional regulator [Streptomyces sp. BE303]MED7954873.1 MarR family transcriptional regulator [Streptomyces sp. BE303]
MTTTPTDDAASSSPVPNTGANPEETKREETNREEALPGEAAPGEAGSGEANATEARAADTAAELADAMTRAIKRIRRRTSERLEPYGITPGQGRALRALAHAPGCELPGRAMRLSDLADRLHIAPRSATTVVDALEEAGMVERAPDPADRRAVRIVLTAAGRSAVEQIGQVRHEVAQEYFGPVSPADQDVLLRALRTAEAAYAATTPPCRPSPGAGR